MKYINIIFSKLPYFFNIPNEFRASFFELIEIKLKCVKNLIEMEIPTRAQIKYNEGVRTPVRLTRNRPSDLAEYEVDKRIRVISI
jgi:hypothetical protein